MADTIDYAAWNARYAIPGAAELVAGEGGFAKLQIRTEACEAEVYLYGAQVTRWKPAGAEDVLFLSSESKWQEGKAIRGGIPICFPWFRSKAGAPDAPAHGLVRTQVWSLKSVEKLASGAIAAEFHTASDEWQKRWWQGQCDVLFRVEAGRELVLSLSVTNTGSEPFHFEEALHSYFQVADVHQVAVEGLDGAKYLDNTDNNAQKQQSGPVRFTKQTDNAYVQTESALALVDGGGKRRLITEKQNSGTTVVWNPWQDGAAKFADLGGDEWERFACVEASNILASGVELQPGAQHTLTAKLRVEH